MSNRISRGLVAALMLVTVLAPFSAIRAESESEETSPIDLWGQLIELSSTEAPTTVIVRKNPAGEFTDYTVDIDTETAFGTNAGNTTSMDDWITGDSLHVIGTLNENTGVVTADTIVNGSLSPLNYRGLNGWITAIGDDSLTVQWRGVEHNVNVTSDTRMVVPPINPAAITDFQVGDRVRIRLVKGTEDARIVIALRRGSEIFLKARTRGFWAEITDIDETDEDSGKIDATLLANPHLRSGDVNNMVGNEGDSIDINYDENTKFVRKFMGSSDISEFQIGDKLFVIGRVSDEGEIDARLIKDNSMWKKGVAKHVGTIDAVDVAGNSLVLTALNGSSAEKTVEVSYSDDTEFREGGEETTEDALVAGRDVRVRGIARRDASGNISITDVDTIILIPVETDDESDEDADEEEADDEDEDEDEDEDSDEDEDEASGEDSDDEDSSEELPDLVVSEIELSSSNTIEAELENEGEADVDVPVTVYFYLDGVLSWTYSSSTLSDQDFLEEGESSTISPQSIEATTVVKVCVDALEVVSESDEDNNCLEATLEVEADDEDEE